MTQAIAFNNLVPFPRLERAGGRALALTGRAGARALLVTVLVSTGSLALAPCAAADEPAWGAAPSASWAGAYAGVEVGPGQSVTEVKAGGAKRDMDRFDAAFGAFAGYNWQMSRMVLGVEAGAAYLGGEAKETHPALGTVRASSRWSATLKGRVGYAFDRVMPYLSAGLAVADHTLKANGETRRSTNVAPVLGAGLEVMATDRLMLRADYSLQGTVSEKASYGGTTVERNGANHRLMIGVGYRF